MEIACYRKWGRDFQLGNKLWTEIADAELRDPIQALRQE
jgi:hypothetical protein